MNKTFSKIEVGQFKRIAQNLYPYQKKVQKLKEKIESLKIEMLQFCEIIESQEDIVRKITGGYTTADIITRTVNENGQAQFSLKYPDTVIPPCENEANCEATCDCCHPVRPEEEELKEASPMSND